MKKDRGWNRGYTQVYTGNGKGKTTAALGLALRAAGAGLNVFIGQFMKGQRYSELDSVKNLAPHITIEQFGHPEFCVPGKVSPEDIRLAAAGLRRSREAIASGDFDIVILDEINTALFFKLITVNEVLDLINTKPESVELIITGRYAPEEIIAAADLATEMKEIKHYYQAGVKSRRGIEN